MTSYPVGGPREAVYSLMRNLGFSMSGWSDKHWKSADGIEVRIYGAGSKASTSLDGNPAGECELDDFADHIYLLRNAH